MKMKSNDILELFKCVYLKCDTSFSNFNLNMLNLNQWESS